jgi:hypothetical protein
LSALIGWAIEPLEEPVGHHEEHDDDPRTDLEEPELEGDEETVR